MTLDPTCPHPDDIPILRALAGTRSDSVGHRLRLLRELGLLNLPRPGRGETWLRFRRLAEIAADDLSLARLAEGHCDAVSILEEAGLTPVTDSALYGVWVAGAPLITTRSAGRTVVGGERAYCSGSNIIDRALITSRYDGEGPTLFEIDANAPNLELQPGSWPAIGMADTRSHSVNFVSVEPLRQVGGLDFYENRPGFWNGSPNPAACWYGGALGLARGVAEFHDGSAIRRILHAEISVPLMQMRAVLVAAAQDIDNRPEASQAERQLRALIVRDVVYRGCLEVIRAAAELGGTHQSTHDLAQAKRLADLPVYLRQHHPMQDREHIGELLQSLPLMEEG